MSGADIHRELDRGDLGPDSPPHDDSVVRQRESVKRKRLDLSCVYCQRLFAKPEHLKVCLSRRFERYRD